MAPKLPPDDTWEDSPELKGLASTLGVFDQTTKQYVDLMANGVEWVGEKPKNPAHGQIWFDPTTDEAKFFDGNNWIKIADGSMEEYKSPVIKTFNPVTSKGIWHLELVDYGSIKQLQLQTEEDGPTNVDNNEIINLLKEAVDEKAWLFLEKEILDFLS